MLATQYSFTLPADYDMERIEQRIRANGHRLNGFEGLAMKLYLYARKDDPECASELNLYAPLYLWRNVTGINRFLKSEGFAALSAQFGRPRVDVWLVEQATELGREENPGFASRRIIPYGSALASDGPQLIANDYSDWRRLEVTLANQPPETQVDEVQNYRIGYIARG